jgi:hypothetical protein
MTRFNFNATGKARALIVITILAISGFALVLLLGRPRRVAFVSFFECSRFSPGSDIALDFQDCTELKFHADRGFEPGTIRIPRSSYKPEYDNTIQSSPTQNANVDVMVPEGAPVTAAYDGKYGMTGSVTISGDGFIDSRPSSQATNLGQFRISSDTLKLSIGGLGFMLTTPSDNHRTGFADGISRFRFGRIAVNKYEESQGGNPPEVIAWLSNISSPVSIRGVKDEVTGWRPIALEAGSSREEPLEIDNARLWGEKVSSCTLSINNESVDVATTADRIQIDVVNASITKLTLYQEGSEGYIAVAVSGTAESIKLNNKEMVETVLSHLLSRPSYQSGLAGLSLVFLIFAGGIFLKRAIEVLAESSLPKS